MLVIGMQSDQISVSPHPLSLTTLPVTPPVRRLDIIRMIVCRTLPFRILRIRDDILMTGEIDAAGNIGRVHFWAPLVGRFKI